MSSQSLAKYQKKDLATHIYDTPDTYVGGSDLIEDVLPILSSDKTISNETFEYIPALYNIFNEILVNARDQVVRLQQLGSSNPVTAIKITIDKVTGMITIYNDGEGVDVAEHPTEKDSKGVPIMIPEMIFGHLLTSTNYEKEEKKIVGGKNGYGAKLTNIFSTYFKLETIDQERGLKYVQEFKDNMKDRGKPKITKNKGKSFEYVKKICDYEPLKMIGSVVYHDNRKEFEFKLY